jgi:hypothetical protein
MAQSVEPLTCLLLLGGNAEPEPALLNAMADRRLRPAVRRDALETMVELCLRMRGAAPQRPPEEVVAALAAAHPESIPQWDDLRAAVQRHLPEVPVLEWSGRVLRSVADPGHDPGGPLAVPPPRSPEDGTRRPAWRPATAPVPPAEAGPPEATAHRGHASAPEPRAAVSGEEIRMLLEPSPKVP